MSKEQDGVNPVERIKIAKREIDLAQRQIQNLSLGEVVELLPQEVRPTIVTIQKPGWSMMMLIPKQAPSFGLLLWTKSLGNIGDPCLDLRFYDAETLCGDELSRTNTFWSPCLCCCFKDDCTIDFKARQPRDLLNRNLCEQIIEAVKKHKISKVFASKGEFWQENLNIPGMSTLEPNKFLGEMVKFYGEDSSYSFQKNFIIYR